ncbi:MAG: hypothetical protein PUB37_07310 [Firmicutes bacterium]|nr:hypothetical protein [Bacillota bacterium]
MANEKKENNSIASEETSIEKKNIQSETKNKKKLSPAVIAISAAAALLVVLVVSLGVLFALATSDTMPKAPLVSTDMSTLIKDSAIEMIKDKKITFTSDEVNLCLKTLVEKSSETLEKNGIRVKDLFVVINNDKATIYCRAVYKGITWPIRAVADINYDDPYIVVGFSSASIGKLELPTNLLMEYVGDNIAVTDISVHNGFIYYDTTTFNDKLSDMTLNALGLKPSDIESGNEDGNSNDDGSFSWSKWWQKFIGGISDTFKDWAAKLISDFIHNISFKDIKIIDNEIILEVAFDEGTSDTAGGTVSADAAA